VYGTTSNYSAVVSFNAAVQDVMEQVIPRGNIKYMSKFPHWYSVPFRYYIKENNYFTYPLKKKSYCLYKNFSFNRKLVNATIKFDRLRWLKSDDENLKSQPKQFWKNVASVMKRNSVSILLEVDCKHLIESCDVSDQFSKHFQSVNSNLCPIAFPTFSSSSEFLSLAPVSDSDILKLLNT
jgi:hypothetical protein